MEVIIAGGVGEHGRNCFFIEHKKTPVIFDCGILAGDPHPHPHLTPDQARGAKYLFVSHSHKDHTGAIPWLLEQGFSGTIVATQETSRQLDFRLPHLICIDMLGPCLTEIPLSEEVRVMWGKTGHCLGSVWYKIFLGEKEIIYSGDYIEDVLVYEVDPIRHQKADIGIIEHGYGPDPEGAGKNREKLLSVMKNAFQVHSSILLPVPKYGRNLELLLFLSEHFPKVPLFADNHLQREISRLAEAKSWIKAPAFEKLAQTVKKISPIENIRPGVFFISDPQITEKKNQKLAESFSKAGEMILLTGGSDKGSYGKKMKDYGLAQFSRYAVHLNDIEMNRLIKHNQLLEVIPFHS